MRRQRRAAQHRRHRIDAQKSQAFNPFREAAVEIDIDARESAGIAWLLRSLATKWRSGPVRFRAIREPNPEHSAPIPPPNR